MNFFQLPQFDLKSKFEHYKYVLLVIGVGLFLMLLPTQTKQETQQITVSSVYQVEEFEARLAGILSLIEGAGETQVIVTLKNEGKRILAQDIEQEGGGQGTMTTVRINSGSGTQEVVEIEHEYPQFQGVVVVCDGGGSARVKLEIIAAVSALTGLDSNAISISKHQ